MEVWYENFESIKCNQRGKKNNPPISKSDG